MVNEKGAIIPYYSLPFASEPSSTFSLVFIQKELSSIHMFIISDSDNIKDELDNDPQQ